MSNDQQAGVSSCCGHGAAPEPTQATQATAENGRENLLAPAEDDLATCPVMVGSTVVKSVAEAAGLYRDYEGQRYWLCCAGCGPAFDADPARYATAS